jgi:hypothetical protein
MGGVGWASRPLPRERPVPAERRGQYVHAAACKTPALQVGHHKSRVMACTTGLVLEFNVAPAGKWGCDIRAKAEIPDRRYGRVARVRSGSGWSGHELLHGRERGQTANLNDRSAAHFCVRFHPRQWGLMESCNVSRSGNPCRPFPTGRKKRAGIVKSFPTGRKLDDFPLDNISCLRATLRG